MPVTRRQLLLAKDNNKDERVAEFEKFFRADVGRAERSTKRAVPKKNIFEKIDKNEVSSVFARSIKSPILGDNEESFACPDFQLTEVHESPDEAPRDRSMIFSPADSGIGENAEAAISSSDLSLYADELDRQNDNLTLDIVGRNSIDSANDVVEIDTEIANKIKDFKTEPDWSDDEYEVPANKSLSYGEIIEDYQRFKHNKELTQLINVNSAAFMGLMKTTFRMTGTEESTTPQAPESIGPITARKRVAPRVAKAPKGQKGKRVPGQFPAKLRALAKDDNVPSVKLTEEGVGFIFFPDKFEQDYLQVASKQEKQPISTKKWPSFQRNLNNYGFKQFNFKDVKAKKTGQKMFFRPDELLAAYPSGSKAHNYKIAKTPQIKKENKKLMTCTALETQRPQPVLPFSQPMMIEENYPQGPFYSQIMHPYPPISYPSTRYDHQLTDFASSMLPPLSSFRPEEQKPTFDNELSIMEIHTAPDLGPILNPFELNHL